MSLNGILLVDKPKGITSAHCLNKLKKRFKPKKIGHAGTLDPLATGLLVVMLGQATKISQFLMQGIKTYHGVLELGKTSVSYDLGSEVLPGGSWEHILPETIYQEVKAWEKLKTQIVPPISAAKHKGKPLYFRARKGQSIPVKEKNIEIFYAEAVKIELPRVYFRVRCSAGTYIRSLAHSLGKRLGCGAILTELRRTECAPFTLQEAKPLEEVLELNEIDSCLLSIAQGLANWPQIKVNPYLEQRLKHGGSLDLREIPVLPKTGQRILALSLEEKPIAILECTDVPKPKWKILRGLWN